MTQRTTTVSLGLFAAWACHDLEELFTMRETSRLVAPRMPDWVPIPDDVRQDGLSQQHVNLSISLVGAYLAGVCAVGVRSQGRSRLFRSALLGFGLHGFGHIAGTVALRQYTTGVATSPTIVIPYWLWARRTLAREGLSDREGTVRWAGATLLLLPVVHVATRLLLNALEAAALRESAMSEENVEIVRRGYEAFNAFMRGELTSEATVEVFDSQIQWDWHDKQTFPDAPQHLRSAAEVIEFWEQLRSAWVDVAADPLEFVEAPDDRVLAFIHQTGRGRESGLPVESHFFQLWTIRDGKVRKMELFRHHADALEAAGLRE